MRSPIMAVLAAVLACSSGEPRGTSTQADATTTRRAAIDAGAPPPASSEPLSCQPYSTCGCELGCLLVRRVGGSTERWAIVEGEQAGQVLVRESPGWPLRLERAEACDESCRPAQATRICRAQDGACIEQTTSAQPASAR